MLRHYDALGLVRPSPAVALVASAFVGVLEERSAEDQGDENS